MNITPEMIQRFQNMRNSGQGMPRDTAAFRRMMNNPNRQPGAPRDTAARRRIISQPRQGGGTQKPAQDQSPVRN
jgi:hypothetical protein